MAVVVKKNPPANAGDPGDTHSVHGLGGSLGEGNGDPLQYSCLENPIDREAWQATRVGHSFVTKPPLPPPQTDLGAYSSMR